MNEDICNDACEDVCWTTREGIKIKVEDMTLDHVEKVLTMLIKQYTSVCIQNGARYAPQIRMDNMSENEKRQMLINTCKDRKTLKAIVMRQCFGDI